MRYLITILFPFFLNAQKISDDTKHFYAGFGIAVLSGEITNQIINKPAISALIGIGLGSGITWGKEIIFDRYLNKGVYNKHDGFIGTMGAICGGMVIRVKFDIYERRNTNRYKEN